MFKLKGLVSNFLHVTRPLQNQTKSSVHIRGPFSNFLKNESRFSFSTQSDSKQRDKLAYRISTLHKPPKPETSFGHLMNNGIPTKELTREERFDLFREFQNIRHDVRADRITDEELLEWVEKNILHEVSTAAYQLFKHKKMTKEDFFKTITLGNPFDRDPMDESYYLYGRIQYKVPRDGHWSRISDPYKSYSKWNFAVGDEVPVRVNIGAITAEKLFETREREVYYKQEGLDYLKKYIELNRLENSYAALDLEPETQKTEETRKDLLQQMYKVMDSIKEDGQTGIRELDEEVATRSVMLEHRVNDQITPQEQDILNTLMKTADKRLDKLNTYEKLSACVSLLSLMDHYLISNTVFNDLSARFWPQEPIIPNDKDDHSAVLDQREYFIRTHLEQANQASRDVEYFVTKDNPYEPLNADEFRKILNIHRISSQKHRAMMLRSEVLEDMIERLVSHYMSKEEIEHYLKNQRDFEAKTDLIVNRRKLLAMEVEYREAEFQQTKMEENLRVMNVLQPWEHIPMFKDYHEIHKKFGLKPDFRFPTGRSDLQNMRRTLMDGDVLTHDEQARVRKGIAAIGVRFDNALMRPGMTVDDVEVAKLEHKEDAAMVYCVAKTERFKENNRKASHNDVSSWLELEKAVYKDWIHTNERKINDDHIQHIIWELEKEKARRVVQDRMGGRPGGKWLHRWSRKIMYLFILLGILASLRGVYYYFWDWYDELVVDDAALFNMLIEELLPDILAHPDLVQHFDNLNPVIDEPLIRQSYIPFSAPSGPNGIMITFPLIGYNGKRAVVTIQAYEKEGRRHMWRIFPVTIDLMNGKTIVHPLKDDIIDGIGLMNEIIEKIVDSGESPPLFGLPNLFGNQSLDAEDQARIMRERKMIPEKWE